MTATIQLYSYDYNYGLTKQVLLPHKNWASFQSFIFNNSLQYFSTNF